MEDEMNEKKVDPFLIRTLTLLLIIANIIFAIRVFDDIVGTGIIMKEVSPDGQYEVIVSRDKFPKMFERSIDLNTIELYDKKSGQLISCFENETELLMDGHTDIDFVWSEDGLLVTMQGGVWLDRSYAECFLPF